MIAYAGMSDKLPNICYYNNNEYNFQRPYSETTAKIMDDEVLKMINEQYDRAKSILTEHKEGHAQLPEAQQRAEAEAMAERRAKELEREAAAKAENDSKEQQAQEDGETSAQ